MPQCVVPGCKNHPDKQKKSSGITYHKFPNKEDLRQRWVRAIGLAHCVPSKRAHVCSAHFKEEDMDRTSLCVVRVREGAIPTCPQVLSSKEDKTEDPALSDAAFLTRPLVEGVLEETALSSSTSLTSPPLLREEYEIEHSAISSTASPISPPLPTDGVETEVTTLSSVEHFDSDSHPHIVSATPTSLSFDSDAESDPDMVCHDVRSPWTSHHGKDTVKSIINWTTDWTVEGLKRIVSELSRELIKLRKKMEDIKMAARINLDLLTLAVDYAGHTACRDELDNVANLVNLILNDTEELNAASSLLETRAGSLVTDVARSKLLVDCDNGNSLDESRVDHSTRFHTGVISGNGVTNHLLQQFIGKSKDHEESIHNDSIQKSHLKQQHGGITVPQAAVTCKPRDMGPPKTCRHCGEKFPSKHKLRIHKTFSRTHKCSECGKSFCHAYKLDAHMNIHLGFEPNVCRDCGKSCSDAHALLRPVLVHTKEKRFSCDICGKGFDQSCNALRHRKTHLKEKRMCPSCGQIFSHQDHFHKHRCTHKTGMRSRHGRKKGSSKEVQVVVQESGEMIRAVSRVTDVTRSELLVDGEDGDGNDSTNDNGLGESSADYNTLDGTESDGVQSGGNSGDKVKKCYSRKPQPSVKGKNECVCDHCGKVVGGIVRLEQHMKRHKNPYKCSECGEEFLWLKPYCKHMRQSHPTVRPFKCDLCITAFCTQTDLEVHVDNIHRNKTPKKQCVCDHCGMVVDGVGRLKQHILRHKNAHICSECGEEFLAVKPYRKHMRQSHPTVRPFQCDICIRTFSLQIDLDIHVENVHRLKNATKCTLCTQTFQTEQNLRKHMKLHLGPQPHRCTRCSRGFSHEKDLNSHMALGICKTRDMGAKTCKHCGEKFATIPKLIIHETETHNIKKERRAKKTYQIFPRSHKCSECDQSFCHAYQLDAHMNIHLGLETNVCRHCGKTFTSLCVLEMHIVRVHTQEKRYSCDICGKRFKHYKQLPNHRKIHSGVKPFLCPVCGKGFHAMSTLNFHSWTHRSEKRYHCEHCGKGYNDKRNLMQHYLTHSSNAQLE